MEDKRPLDFISYLKIDQMLELQDPLSFHTAHPAHDEMMYIIVHQAYELWFKLIIYELESIIKTLGQDFVAERDITLSVSRFRRIHEVQKLLLQQFQVLETMTPLDFLDFRGLLSTASGFQSFQFRMIENRLGIDPAKRLVYGNMPYHKCFTAELQAKLLAAENEPSLFSALQGWLERTPFLDHDSFHFLASYESAVKRMLNTETPFAEGAGASYTNATGSSHSAFYSESEYERLRAKGAKRLSWRATLAALFISLYRDEPVLSQPFRLIESLVELDEQFALWRYRHALVVHKMLGKRSGTAGSSGFDYLRDTVERHRVFSDLFDVATLLIPRSDLPAIPEVLRAKMDFALNRKG